jgi:WHG domain-containing protein
VRALRTAVHGFAALEAAGGFGRPLDRDASFRRLVDALARGPAG